MADVKVLIKEIKDNLKQKSVSGKDEIAVATAMLNDKNYIVDVYGNSGVEGQYSPREDAVKMIASVITSTAKINKEEAAILASDHEFSKSEAGTFVNVGKEFFNTYLQTGRKINLGGRETTSTSLIAKDIEAGVCRYPSKDENGASITAEKDVPAYTAVKAKSSCPAWVK